VINTIQSFSAERAKVDEVSLDGDKLHLKASVPSPVVANRVWDSIKQVDPTYADLHHEITTTGSTQRPQQVSEDCIGQWPRGREQDPGGPDPHHPCVAIKRIGTGTLEGSEIIAPFSIHGLRSRQLRFLHLQPGAIHG
jgi:hypothetical protein